MKERILKLFSRGLYMLSPEDIQAQELIEKATEDIEEINEPEVERDSKNFAIKGQDKDILKERIGEMLGEDDSKRNNDKLETILDYAIKRGAKSPEDILWQVRKLSNRLGSASIGDTDVNHLYRYIYLLGESASIESSIREMEGI